jgi:hypothetical protein
LDIYTLSSEAAMLIAPYLPTLISKGQLVTGKALEEIGKQVGSTAWAGVKEVWEKLHAAADTPDSRHRLGEIAQEQDVAKRTDALRSFIGDVIVTQPQAQIQIAKAIQNISNSTNININIS